jgi:hypothetical protein
VVKGVTVSNSYFDTLHQGVVLETDPTGARLVQNTFDNIYAQGIEMGTISLNGTGHNIFYDVGNHFDGVLQPATTIIDIDGNNNVCIGDMFERSDANASNYSRININRKQVIATTNGLQLALGTYVRESGNIVTLLNNRVSPTTIFTVNTDIVTAFCINYTIVRDGRRRTGSIMVSNQITGGSGNPVYTDDYVQTVDTGIILSVTQVSTTASFQYTSTNLTDATLTYSVTRLV